MKCKLSEEESEDCEYPCVIPTEPQYDPLERYQEHNGLYVCKNLEHGDLHCKDESGIDCDGSSCAIFLSEGILPKQKKGGIFCCLWLKEKRGEK
jgi:hypothetical protein